MNPLQNAPGFESVLITEGERVVLRADGFGPQVEPMIEAARRRFRQRLPHLAHDAVTTPDRMVALLPDQVVTRNGRVVALLVPNQHGGGDLMVIRINPERPPQPEAGTRREPTLTVPNPAEGGNR